MWKAAIAALALPVSGFVIGKVVGDYFVHANFWMARIGGGTGLLVYVFTLLASYKHLRNFFHTFEPENVKASHTLAIAVEVATFYMSVSAVMGIRHETFNPRLPTQHVPVVVAALEFYSPRAPRPLHRRAFGVGLGRIPVASVHP